MPRKNLLPLFSPQVHHWIYFICLCILAASLPTSRFMLSFIQIAMGVNWLLEGNYKIRILRFVQNRAAWMLVSIYLLHVLGLLWSEDLAYGIASDLKNKLPLLTLTFMVFSSPPPDRTKTYLLLYVFFASLLVTSLIGLYIYLSGDYVNFRHISPFVSHVYLSMMLVFALFTLPWFTGHLTQNRKVLFLSWVIAIWFLVFLFILRSLTGILCLAGVMVWLAGRWILTGRTLRQRIIAGVTLAVLPLLFLIPSWMAYQNLNLAIEPGKEALQETTVLGNPYSHYPENKLRENGHYVFLFIAEEETRKAWNERSDLDFDGQDLAGNALYMTLYRYMASKGLRKDYAGVYQLDPEDLEAIEKGIANYNYTRWPGLKVRLHQTFWEIYWYRERGNPSGHTFTQRLELWRASAVAFKEKPLWGWGTGDIFIAVDYGLNQLNSPMDNYRMKPHNQYLLFLLTLGVAGSLLIYLMYGVYIKETGVFRFWPFQAFLVIMLISMLGNNPIDAQVGQSFFIFFTLYMGYFFPQACKGQLLG